MRTAVIWIFLWPSPPFSAFSVLQHREELGLQVDNKQYAIINQAPDKKKKTSAVFRCTHTHMETIERCEKPLAVPLVRSCTLYWCVSVCCDVWVPAHLHNSPQLTSWGYCSSLYFYPYTRKHHTPAQILHWSGTVRKTKHNYILADACVCVCVCLWEYM